MTTVQDVIDRNIEDRTQRMADVEAFLLDARLNERKLTGGEMDTLNSYILREELRYSHADKMTFLETPFHSESQTLRRAKKELPLEMAKDYATDGRQHRKPVRRKRSYYEEWYVNKHARAENAERQRKYNEFTKIQPVETYYI
ncbi:hypothetical protein JCM19037_1581 [Geomicrobium sp. JCM 19037]|uniref:hypothetical protein n=1 Tax=Geomicrobium sp. JCM 19037 TaxID=1460634 RepID=UPI00045F4738|nr:hypothetical protein [Geomicrobium sp. JCM 19037]GAK03273.1 hypothetical protein JCM19037_1581 [Geomicrobium sp. JCM 19037]